MKYHDNIRNRRIALGITQADLATQVGYDSVSTISCIEHGKIDITLGMLEAIAKALYTTPIKLIMGEDYHEEKAEEPNISQSYKIPVYDTLESIEVKSDKWLTIPMSLARSGTYFAVRMSDKSMHPVVQKNDVLIVKKQKSLGNGNLVIVRMTEQGNITCCKSVRSHDGFILLWYHTKQDAIFFTKEEFNEKVEVLGKVVEIRKNNML